MIYSYLLKAEVTELTKDKEAAWDRIIQIRHLKDRMIRKCQRLARDSSSVDKNTGRMMMFTVHAPPDFKLKEMERWFRDQGADFVQDMARRPAAAPQHYCSKCGPLDSQATTQQHRTLPPSSGAVTSGLTATRSTITSTRSTTPTRLRSTSQSVPRSRSNVDLKRGQSKASKASQAARVPERIPKHHSNSSSDTAIDSDSKPVRKLPKEFLKQLPTPSVSRSNSTRSTGPINSHPSATAEPVAAVHVATASPSSVPTVIRQSDTPPRLPTPKNSDEDLKSQVSVQSARSGSATHPARMSIQSPEPLPIPYRPRMHAFSPSLEPPMEDFQADSEDDSEDEDDLVNPVTAEASSEPLEIPRVSSPDSTLIDVQAEAPPQDDPRQFIEPPTTGQPLETIHEKSEVSEPHTGRPLVRRRSSLKKRDSMSRLSAASQSKSVTWAMDRDWSDQMSKFVKSTNEAEVAGECHVLGLPDSRPERSLQRMN